MDTAIRDEKLQTLHWSPTAQLFDARGETWQGRAELDKGVLYWCTGRF